MGLLVLGLVLFLGVHSVRIVAPGWRGAMIGRIGEGPWKGIYTLISLVGLAVLVWGYASAPTVILARPPAFWLVHVVIVLMAFALIALMVSVLPAGRLKPRLKHPMLLSVKIWAIAHLIVNYNDLASLILFGSFLVWAGIDRMSVGRRGGALPQPGPVRNDIIAVVVGLVVWLAFIYKVHEWVAGVPVPIG